MLSPDECRRIDPELSSLTDEQLAEAVALLEQLAELALMEWFRSQQERGSLLPPGIVPFPADALS